MVVEQIRRKELIIPILFGILFSVLYPILPLKYFAAAFIGLIGVVLILYDVKIGLMAGVFILPFLPDMLNLLFMYFLLAVFVFNNVVKDANPLTKTKVDMPIILYLIIIVLSTITSINPVGSLRDLALHMGGLSFLFVMINTVKEKKDFNTIVTVLVFSATLVALYGLYQYVVGVEIEAAWVDMEANPGMTTRVYSVFNNPNILAEYLEMIIPLSVALFWYSKKLSKKVIFLGTTLIMVLALVLTQSRGGWLGFAFSALIFIILIEKRLLLTLIPISIAGVFLLPDSIINRILSIGNLSDSSNAYRITMWGITLDIIRDYWVAGVGFGHQPFKQTFETYIRTMPTFHAHNTYLETAAEMGIPGLIAFLLFLFVSFKYGVKYLVKQDDKYIKVMAAGVLAGLGAVLFHGLVENILYLPKIIITFWIMVSLILTLLRIKEKENEIS
ncbi:MAG: O-antigen ligase family protein [Tissierellaceae bacterium]|nr:O-antigen ligase family protein [Tissierellaceae bacterium]